MCIRDRSYADAQPGDLICYGGHVAIYMGNGRIVHASNSVDGIKTVSYTHLDVYKRQVWMHLSWR